GRHQVDRGPDGVYQQRGIHLVEHPPGLANVGAAGGRTPGRGMGLGRLGQALFSRSAGFARARRRRRDPDPARTKEKAADRIRARLKTMDRGVDAAAPFHAADGDYLTVSAPALHATPSWSPVAPLQPIAPMSLPPSMSGKPPWEATSIGSRVET